MINHFKHYMRFLVFLLREKGIQQTGVHLWDFLKRRLFGITFLLEWIDFQVLSFFRPTGSTLISVIDPDESLKKPARWALYSSFDRDSKISHHVLSQLSFLKAEGFSILFLSSSPELGAEAQKILAPLCSVIVHRKNSGHDFGSWKTGYDLIRSNLNRNHPVVLMNDSCFGPYLSLDSLFRSLKQHPSSVTGVSKSYLIEEHIQSYFLGFGTELVQNGIFDQYMARVRLLKTKAAIIRFFEIGGSAFLKKRDILLEALIDPKKEPISSIIQEFKSDNALLDPMGKALVERGLMPFYKRSNGAPLDQPLISA